MNFQIFLKRAAQLTVVLLLVSCDDAAKKDEKSSTTPEISATEPTSKTGSIDLEQKADYARLYAIGDSCKMTAEETATLYNVPIGKVKQTYNQSNNAGYSCTYLVDLEDDFRTTFALTAITMSQADVRNELEKLTTGEYEMNFITTSEAGDNYIWKHPNQGYYVLYNPNYANGLQVRYRTLMKMTEEQVAYLENKGKEAIEYLINNYKD